MPAPKPALVAKQSGHKEDFGLVGGVYRKMLGKNHRTLEQKTSTAIQVSGEGLWQGNKSLVDQLGDG